VVQVAEEVVVSVIQLPDDRVILAAQIPEEVAVAVQLQQPYLV
jgi:hypothetical protein